MNIVNSLKETWSEKYRPKKLKDMILPNNIYKIAESIICDAKSGNMNHMLFSGSPGLGKTTLAHVIGLELNMQVMYLNASLERNLDTLRNKIVQFMSSSSLDDRKKLLICDEADKLNPESTQPAFRVPLEQLSDNCTVIFCTNYPDAIIDPLKSRFAHIEFDIPSSEKEEIQEKIFNRISFILNTESIKYDEDVVVAHVLRFYPDFRKTINELQILVKTGQINDPSIIEDINKSSEEIFIQMKEKNFTKVHNWVMKNVEGKVVQYFDVLKNNMKRYVKTESFPDYILILNKYSYQHAFVIDRELNFMACVTELMTTCEFK